MTIDLDHFPYESDVEFVKALLREKSVYVMPGKVSDQLVLIVTFNLHPYPQAFFAQASFRVVLILPDKKITEACKRIAAVCSRHYTP